MSKSSGRLDVSSKSPKTRQHISWLQQRSRSEMTEDSGSDNAGPFQFLCIKVSTWRGRYHRILRLTLRGVSTLDPSKGATQARTTNKWTWAQIKGCSPSLKNDEEIVFHFKADEPVLRLLVAPSSRASVLEAFYNVAKMASAVSKKVKIDMPWAKPAYFYGTLSNMASYYGEMVPGSEQGYRNSDSDPFTLKMGLTHLTLSNDRSGVQERLPYRLVQAIWPVSSSLTKDMNSLEGAYIITNSGGVGTGRYLRMSTQPNIVTFHDSKGKQTNAEGGGKVSGVLQSRGDSPNESSNAYKLIELARLKCEKLGLQIYCAEESISCEQAIHAHGNLFPAYMPSRVSALFSAGSIRAAATKTRLKRQALDESLMKGKSTRDHKREHTQDAADVVQIDRGFAHSITDVGAYVLSRTVRSTLICLDQKLCDFPCELVLTPCSLLIKRRNDNQPHSGVKKSYNHSNMTIIRAILLSTVSVARIYRDSGLQIIMADGCQCAFRFSPDKKITSTQGDKPEEHMQMSEILFVTDFISACSRAGNRIFLLEYHDGNVMKECLLRSSLQPYHIRKGGTGSNIPFVTLCSPAKGRTDRHLRRSCEGHIIQTLANLLTDLRSFMKTEFSQNPSAQHKYMNNRTKGNVVQSALPKAATQSQMPKNGDSSLTRNLPMPLAKALNAMQSLLDNTIPQTFCWETSTSIKKNAAKSAIRLILLSLDYLTTSSDGSADTSIAHEENHFAILLCVRALHHLLCTEVAFAALLPAATDHFKDFLYITQMNEDKSEPYHRSEGNGKTTRDYTKLINDEPRASQGLLSLRRLLSQCSTQSGKASTQIITIEVLRLITHMVDPFQAIQSRKRFVASCDEKRPKNPIADLESALFPSVTRFMPHGLKKAREKLLASSSVSSWERNAFLHTHEVCDLLARVPHLGSICRKSLQKKAEKETTDVYASHIDNEAMITMLEKILGLHEDAVIEKSSIRMPSSSSITLRLARAYGLSLLDIILKSALAPSSSEKYTNQPIREEMHGASVLSSEKVDENIDLSRRESFSVDSTGIRDNLDKQGDESSTGLSINQTKAASLQVLTEGTTDNSTSESSNVPIFAHNSRSESGYDSRWSSGLSIFRSLSLGIPMSGRSRTSLFDSDIGRAVSESFSGGTTRDAANKLMSTRAAEFQQRQQIILTNVFGGSSLKHGRLGLLHLLCGSCTERIVDLNSLEISTKGVATFILSELLQAQSKKLIAVARKNNQTESGIESRLQEGVAQNSSYESRLNQDFAARNWVKGKMSSRINKLMKPLQKASKDYKSTQSQPDSTYLSSIDSQQHQKMDYSHFFSRNQSQNSTEMTSSMEETKYTEDDLMSSSTGLKLSYIFQMPLQQLQIDLLRDFVELCDVLYHIGMIFSENSNHLSQLPDGSLNVTLPIAMQLSGLTLSSILAASSSIFFLYKTIATSRNMHDLHSSNDLSFGTLSLGPQAESGNYGRKNLPHNLSDAVAAADACIRAVLGAIPSGLSQVCSLNFVEPSAWYRLLSLLMTCGTENGNHRGISTHMSALLQWDADRRKQMRKALVNEWKEFATQKVGMKWNYLSFRFHYVVGANDMKLDTPQSMLVCGGFWLPYLADRQKFSDDAILSLHRLEHLWVALQRQFILLSSQLTLLKQDLAQGNKSSFEATMKLPVLILVSLAMARLADLSIETICRLDEPTHLTTQIHETILATRYLQSHDLTIGMSLLSTLNQALLVLLCNLVMRTNTYALALHSLVREDGDAESKSEYETGYRTMLTVLIDIAVMPHSHDSTIAEYIASVAALNIMDRLVCMYHSMPFYRPVPRVEASFWPPPVISGRLVSLNNCGQYEKHVHLKRIVSLLLLEDFPKMPIVHQASRLIRSVMLSVPKAHLVAVSAGVVFFALRSILNPALIRQYESKRGIHDDTATKQLVKEFQPFEDISQKRNPFQAAAEVCEPMQQMRATVVPFSVLEGWGKSSEKYHQQKSEEGHRHLRETPNLSGPKNIQSALTASFSDSFLEPVDLLTELARLLQQIHTSRYLEDNTVASNFDNKSPEKKTLCDIALLHNYLPCALVDKLQHIPSKSLGRILALGTSLDVELIPPGIMESRSVALDPVRLVWTQSMRDELLARIDEHLQEFPKLLKNVALDFSVDPSPDYIWCTFPPMFFSDISDDLFCGGFYLRPLILQVKTYGLSHTMKKLGLLQHNEAEKLLECLSQSWKREEEARLLHNDMSTEHACEILDVSPEMFSQAKQGMNGNKIKDPEEINTTQMCLRDAYRKKAVEFGNFGSQGPMLLLPNDIEIAYERLSSKSQWRRSQSCGWLGGLDPVRMDLILNTQIVLLKAHNVPLTSLGAEIGKLQGESALDVVEDNSRNCPLKYQAYHELLSFLEDPSFLKGNLAHRAGTAVDKNIFGQLSKECWKFMELATHVLCLITSTANAATTFNYNIKALLHTCSSIDHKNRGLYVLFLLMKRCLAKEARSAKKQVKAMSGESINIFQLTVYCANILINLMESTGTTWLAASSVIDPEIEGRKVTEYICGLDLVCSTSIGHSIIGCIPIFLAVFGGLHFSQSLNINSSTSKLVSTIPSSHAHFELVIPLMRALIILAKQVPDQLVSAGIVWQVIQLAMKPLLHHTQKEIDQQHPEHDSDVVLAIECLSILARQDDNSRQIMETLLTSGVVSLLVRLKPSEVLTALSSQIKSPTTYWDPISMSNELSKYAKSKSDEIVNQNLSELLSTGNMISNITGQSCDPSDFSFSKLKSERKVGGVYLRIYIEVRGRTDSVYDADFEPLVFCRALCEEIRSLTQIQDTHYKNGTMSSFFSVKRDDNLNLCKEPLQCLLTLLLQTKRPDTVAAAIYECQGIKTLFSILFRGLCDVVEQTDSLSSVSPDVILQALSVTEILLGFPQCAMAAARRLDPNSDNSFTMIDVLTQMLAACRPTYARNTFLNVDNADKVSAPRWAGGILRTIHSLCSKGGMTEKHVTNVILQPSKGLLVSLCDILSSELISLEKDVADNNIAMLTRRRNSSISSSSSFNLSSSPNAPSWLDLSAASIMCLSSLLRHRICGGQVQRVLRQWLPMELHRLARDSSMSDTNFNEFLSTLLLEPVEWEEAVTSEVDEPHLIWGLQELRELRGFFSNSKPAIWTNLPRAADTTTAVDPTESKINYSRLREELFVGEVYVSAFLRCSRDRNHISLIDNSEFDEDAGSRRSHSRNISSSSSISLAHHRNILSRLRNPKIFLKALIRRLRIETGQRRGAGRDDMASSQNPSQMVSQPQQHDMNPANNQGVDNLSEKTTKLKTVNQMGVHLKDIGEALRTLVVSVVRSDTSETGGGIGGIIEYDDVRKIVQLIRRLAQQRLQPLQDAIYVRMQRSSTNGSETYNFMLNSQQKLQDSESSSRSILGQENASEVSVAESKGIEVDNGQLNDKRGLKDGFAGQTHEEREPSPTSQSPPDSPSSLLQSMESTALLFSSQGVIDAGRCLFASSLSPLNSSYSNTSKEDALRAMLCIPESYSAETTCVELLFKLVEHDGGKNGLAKYASQWARKTGSLWDALIAAAQPIRLEAIAPLQSPYRQDYESKKFKHGVSYSNQGAAGEEEAGEKGVEFLEQDVKVGGGYMPHFAHTTMALRVMRALLVEILSPSPLSRADKRDGKNRADEPDFMSPFVARAIRGEQVIPFLVSICRKDAEIAGRGRTHLSPNQVLADSYQVKSSEPTGKTSHTSIRSHRNPGHTFADSGEWNNIFDNVSSTIKDTEMIRNFNYSYSADVDEDLADDILNLLSNDSRCGPIVQARRAVTRREMYPGYDNISGGDSQASSMPAVSLESQATMVRSSSLWSQYTAKGRKDESVNPHAATIPPSSTISVDVQKQGKRVIQHRPPSSSDYRFPSNFAEKYRMGMIIGEGASCEVRECTLLTASNQSRIKKKRRYAVKQVPKRYFSALASSQRGWQRILDEVEMQQKMSHKSIVEVRDVYEDKDYLYVVLELMQGGDLLDRLLDRIEAQNPYSESEVRIVFKQLLNAIKYLHHKCGITHRDIKPENILLSSPEDDTTIKLADFGAACWSRQRGSARMRSYVGSPQYMAPEVIICALRPRENPKGYTPAVDMWSIGVLLYVMLCRRLPFDADVAEREATSDEREAERRLRQRIMSGKFRQMHDVSPPLSLEAKDLIQKLLHVDPARRCTIDQALAHSFMRGTNSL